MNQAAKFAGSEQNVPCQSLSFEGLTREAEMCVRVSGRDSGCLAP